MVQDEEDRNPEDEFQDEPEQLRDTGSSEDEEKPIEQVPSLGTAGDSETVYMSPVDPDDRPETLEEEDLGERREGQVFLTDKPLKESKPEQIVDDSPQEDSPVRIGLPNTVVPDSAIRPVDPVDPKDLMPEKPTVPPLKTAGEGYKRDDDRQNLGPMSFYKRKNLSKGREVPGIEKGEDGVHRQKPVMGSGEDRNQEELEQQRLVPDEVFSQSSGGPLAVDLQPDIIPEIGVDGPSSFRPDGQDSAGALGGVADASDAVDTFTQSILDVLSRMTLNIRKINDSVNQLMDKLEVEDHRDEF